MSLELVVSKSIYNQATSDGAPDPSSSLSIVDRELADAGIVAVSSDGRLTHAYNAALTLCRIALLAAGYRVAARRSTLPRSKLAGPYFGRLTQRNLYFSFSVYEEARPRRLHSRRRGRPT